MNLFYQRHVFVFPFINNPNQHHTKNNGKQKSGLVIKNICKKYHYPENYHCPLLVICTTISNKPNNSKLYNPIKATYSTLIYPPPIS